MLDYAKASAFRRENPKRSATSLECNLPKPTRRSLRLVDWPRAPGRRDATECDARDALLPPPRKV
jgi:hypothetical protein